MFDCMVRTAEGGQFFITREQSHIAINDKINEYKAKGWNIFSIPASRQEGAARSVYACPPGKEEGHPDCKFLGLE